jgi:hypothetical protein
MVRDEKFATVLVVGFVLPVLLLSGEKKISLLAPRIHRTECGEKRSLYPIKDWNLKRN